jgi:DNA-binding response OmpR family regulator
VTTVLVVDDEQDLLSAVSGVLGDEGYDVIECSDGAQALEYLAGERPDAALIDVMMPGMSGLELVERMRKNPRLQGLPIVMMSAVDTLDVSGADLAGFLKKPFQLKRLLDTIRTVSRER